MVPGEGGHGGMMVVETVGGMKGPNYIRRYFAMGIIFLVEK
jgi:hypothetical protein